MVHDFLNINENNNIWRRNKPTKILMNNSETVLWQEFAGDSFPGPLYIALIKEKQIWWKNLKEFFFNDFFKS